MGTTLPLDSEMIRRPESLLYFLQRLNERVATIDGEVARLRKVLNPDKATTPTPDRDFVFKIRQALGVKGIAPLDVTGLHGLLADTQIAQLQIFTADPTLAASNIDANLYDVGSIATYNGDFYYVAAGNPHTWTKIVLGAGTFVTTNTVQNIGPGAQKTFKDAVSLEAKIDKYDNIATAGGGVVAVRYRNAFTAQTASIGATTIYTPPSAGEFQINIYILSEVAGAGTVFANVSFGDGSGSRGLQTAVLTMNAAPLGISLVSFFHSAAATAIQISTTYAAPGTYGMYVVLTQMN